VILSAGLITATITAFCGPIAFLGVAVPQIARLLVGKNEHSALLPVTLLSGMAVSLLCNLLSRLPGLDGALPINAVTSFMGAPIVIGLCLISVVNGYLFRRNRHGCCFNGEGFKGWI